jgi:hypothetical protein
MKLQSVFSKPARAAIVFFLFLGGISVVQARTAKDFFQNSELSDANNYSPAGTATENNDVRLTTSASVLTLNPTNLNFGSINQTNNLSYTIANNNPGTQDNILFLGGGDGINTVSGNSFDVIYLNCPSCSMTFQGPNASDDGIGVLKLKNFTTMQFDVVQSGATLNIAADLQMVGLAKIGSGTLNFSNNTITTVGSGGLTVNGGTVNFLPGANVGSRIGLNVNNPNTGAGTAVTVNLQQSEHFDAIGGTIAMPSSGTNTATINLIGTGTNLGIVLPGGPFTYSGAIAGQGSVSIAIGTDNTFAQTFAGNNTYSGTTTIGSVCTLVIDGNTSGQGNYTVTATPANEAPGTLGGSGTIGLATNGTVTVGRNLAPGPAPSGIGTLHVSTSGTGGVIFGNGSIYKVQVGSMGMSDLLAITGGSIDLTSASDTLSLSSLAGAFDGTDYTIATFTQNVGGGTFNTVQGLPSGYAMQYNPTNIKLVALPQPLQLTGAVSRKMHGTLGPFDVNLLTTDPVECRSSGGNHTLVITFNNYLVSGSASVTTGTGTVSGTPAFSAKTMTIDLVGVSDMQKLVVTLHNVTDRFSQVLPDTPITVNMLIGDTTGNKSVTSSDVAETKFRSGAVPTASTFRDDVTVNGTISASDISLVKLHSGASVPP